MTASNVQPLRRSPASPRVRTLADLLADPTIHPRKPLFGDWLFERGLSMIYAPSGVGKSWLGMGIALAVAGGGSIDKWSATTAKTVLYVDGEMDPADLQSRFRQLILGMELSPDAGKKLHLWARQDQPRDVPFPDLGHEEGRRMLLEKVERLRPALVVLDNVSTLVTVAEENAAESWNPFLATLQALQAAGSAVLVIHHARKSAGSGGYRGSQKLSVLFDTIIGLDKPEYALSSSATFGVRFEKARSIVEGAHNGFTASLEPTFDGKGLFWKVAESQNAELMQLIVAARSRKFPTQTALADHLGISKGEVTKRRNECIASGLVTRADWDTYLSDARALAADDEEAAAPSPF